ncbi:MAG TPA: HAD hydrolase-like protein [Thermoleophilaceae bacterium]|nr:HAD hydrolase-like protein [Thermoleophilaceae bacterium]
MNSVLFDLDGVLVDSRVAITTCINRALRAGDHDERPPQELYRYIGPALADVFVELLGRPREDAAVVACVAAYREIYATESLRLTTLVPGVARVLDAIATTRQLAIASSKPVAFSEPILETLGIRRHFDAVEGPDLNPFGETKTATIAKALAVVGLPAAMVGDRRHDVEGARANGIPCIGVAWGIGSRAELENAGAVAIADRPGDLPAMLKELARVSR